MEVYIEWQKIGAMKGKPTKLPALIVEQRQRFLSSQQAIGLYTAESAIKSTDLKGSNSILIINPLRI